ncbi:hypothetical protein OPV22_020712 [Ensete ventricosum]|uniref:N-acetyltransferase domain-containing protein n=1 Tax=Ensete ventricosum TaxID=4639 RepID=A0AAV8QH23_ENSVE|nr:hypothetical protein OPV22_020712 [Ensete ventricosum]
MQQAKISAFFKPTPDRSDCNDGKQKNRGEVEAKASNGPATSSSEPPVGKFLNKKRSYAQYHLELGQSDFLLRSCSVCGMMYACGDETDEKLHRSFHKNYYDGIQFKGWRDERVISTTTSVDGGRILLVVDGDPPSHRRKVQEVLKIMEKELGFTDGHLLHKLCKVYVFISNHRIIGCLVAEPIKAAHRVIPSSLSGKASNGNFGKSSSGKPTQNLERQCANLQFGGFSFKRDVARRSGLTNKTRVDQWESGAVLCEQESVPALCGFRAIWVVPSQRQKRIASQLLDSARKSFLAGNILEPSQCAFSPPTSAGRALASSFCCSSAYLIYREDDV